MSVDMRAETIGAGPGELDALAARLFGRPYLRLTDEEASQVWDVREAREEATS